MKQIALLGSTGSIGINTLAVVDHLSPEIDVVALAAHSNIEVLKQQIEKYHPKLVAVFDEKRAAELRNLFPKLAIVSGMKGICEVATHPDVSLVVSAMSGTAGLEPTVKAIEASKDIALANKETIVAGGAFVVNLAKEKGVKLLPVDSEHSAIFQCLEGEKNSSISRILLTASGGPFRQYDLEALKKVTAKEALKHPTWQMGPKITVDSSTLMNKGLEVIEAHWLFDVSVDQIDVVVHPQSIIHSMVEFCDGSILAQMSEPSMITPIQYALTYPERKPGLLKPFDFTKMHTLEFFPPDKQRFRCLSLAMEALSIGKTMPCYMNAANEVLVNQFIQGKLSWFDIGTCLERVMEKHKPQPITSLETLLAVEDEARIHAAATAKVSLC